MIKSMTGFASREVKVSSLGRVRVEIRSTNHKFLETVFHLPDGFLFLEDRIKKDIEAKIKRGRLICNIMYLGGQAAHAFINKQLLKRYVYTLKEIKKQFRLKDEANINTLINLPGVLSQSTSKVVSFSAWPHLKLLINRVVDDLVKMRQKEGRALYGYLTSHIQALKADLNMIKLRFKKAIAAKLATIKTDEERSAFLKDSDITEELERLTFHAKNFEDKLSKSGAIGKELDFITQEMQREANTMGAKSFDTIISSRAIKIKSLIEKIREQLQNIE